MTIITRQGKGSPLTFVEADNNLTELDSRTQLGWRDNVIQMVSRGDITAPPFRTFRDNIQLYGFSHIDTQEVFGQFHIDHDYAMGTALYPHVHWAHNTTAVGTVRWGIEYTVAKGHQQMAFGPTTTVYVEQATDGTQYKHYIAEVSDANAIPGTNIEPDTIILMRVFRDATHSNDTLDGDAFGMCLDLHYQADKATTINKKPNFFGA